MTNQASELRAPTIPGWIVGVGVLAILLLATGAAFSLFAPQRLTPPGVEINAAVRVYGAYTFSRNLSLLIVLLLAIIRRSSTMLRVAMGIFSLINLFDAVMDVVEGRYPIVAVALVLSLVSALAVAKLCNPPVCPLSKSS